MRAVTKIEVQEFDSSSDYPRPTIVEMPDTMADRDVQDLYYNLIIAVLSGQETAFRLSLAKAASVTVRPSTVSSVSLRTEFCP